ncbi:Alpha/Beta hydrolase protein [Xylariaceae sp. AK1471]|nr:Alpha/Beta hydrolase protein [Xylariaceae sp. AK1471]
MASTEQISYHKNPPNPYKADYDSELQACSLLETTTLYELENGNQRGDWRFQRKRRDAKPPANDVVRKKHGLLQESRRVPRGISCLGSDYLTLVSSKVIAEDIGIVITYSEAAQSAEPRTLPCIFFIHGGCRYGGTPYSGNYLERAQAWAIFFNAITVSVEYRLSPNESDESPTGEEPTNDCFDALKWVYNQLGAEDSILKYGDQTKLVVFGTSAGGGLAASTVMKWYQGGRGESAETPGDLCGLVLEAPQLDDRCDTESHRQFKDGNMFTSMDAVQGWSASLGVRRGAKDVSIFEAPARATKADLQSFPPTYIEVGTTEPFRDETKNFYNTLHDAGVKAEMRLWEGGFHGFFAADPDALVSRFCNVSKLRWLSQRLGVQDSYIDDEYERVKEEYENKHKSDEEKRLAA